MPTMKAALGAALLRELDAFSREVEAFPDDERLWQTVPGVANSCGNLALHVAGNLQHFVGQVLGGRPYARDREAEFNRRSGSREIVRAELGRAREVVAKTLAGLADGTLDEPYPELLFGRQLPTGVFLVHLACHLAHHLGQAGYLRRALTGDNKSVGPVSIPALADLLET